MTQFTQRLNFCEINTLISVYIYIYCNYFCPIIVGTHKYFASYIIYTAPLSAFLICPKRQHHTYIMVNKNHRLPYRALASSYTQTTTRTVCRAPHNYKITNSKPSSLHTAHPPPPLLGIRKFKYVYNIALCA